MSDSRRQPAATQSAVAWAENPAIGRLLLLAFCLLIFVPAIFRGLMNPDETRYAEVAREMAESGDWVVPHLNYVPFVEKPPLAFWLGALSVKLFGAHPWVFRLVPLLAAILGVLMTYELGSAIGSRRTGLIAGALLATTALYYILAVSIVTDMLFSALLTGAWWTAWRFYQTEGRRLHWLLFFWLFVAFACLAKGPLALVLVAVAGAVFLLLRGELSFALRMRPLTGVLIVGAVSALWAVPLYLRDPRLLDFFYVRLHLSAMGSGQILHSEPWHYYLKSLPMGLFPWSLPAIAALLLAGRQVVLEGRKGTPAGRLWLLSIFAGGFLFLHISKAKLLTYALPLLPAIVLILAEFLDEIDSRAWWVRALVPLQCVIAVAALLVVLLGSEREQVGGLMHSAAFWIAVAAGAGIAAGLVVSSAVSLRGNLDKSLLVLAITASFGFPLAANLAPRLATDRSSGQLCEKFQEVLLSSDLVVVEDNEDFSVPLALGRRVAIMGRAGELGLGLFVAGNPLDAAIPADPTRLKARDLDSKYLLDNPSLMKIWNGAESVCIFAPRTFVSRMKAFSKNVWVLGGQGDLVLASNRNPAASAKSHGG